MKTEKLKEYNVEFTTNISAEATSYEEALELADVKISRYFSDNGFDYDGALVSKLDTGESSRSFEGNL